MTNDCWKKNCRREHITALQKKKELQEWMSALEAMIVCDNIKLERHVIIKKETVHYTLSCPSDCPVFKATIIMLVKK